MVASLQRSSERIRERAALPVMGRRSVHRRGTAPHERRGRQVAQSQDADFRRPDGVRDLPPVLEPAPQHHGPGDRAEGAARSGVHGARSAGDRRGRSGERCGAAADAGEPAAPRRGQARVRQKPGPSNSLGLAKFIFPNDDNVYMHGTPAPQLFSRARRDFSHGCIRLEDPAGFAEWVLRDQPDWPRSRIDQAMQGERPTRVNLKAAAHGRAVLRHGPRELGERGVLRGRHLRRRPSARRRAGQGLSLSGEAIAFGLTFNPSSAMLGLDVDQGRGGFLPLIDGVAFGAGLTLVVAAAALAAYQPARRAARVDPALTLRADS